MARTSGPEGSDNRLARELVGSSQRQRLVRYLLDRDGRAEFDQLVGALAEGSELTTTAVRLHHVHLPKLAAVGAIERTRGSDTIRLTARGRRSLEELGQRPPYDQVGGD
jgi:hypothetical protein